MESRLCGGCARGGRVTRRLWGLLPAARDPPVTGQQDSQAPAGQTVVPSLGDG